MCIIFYNGPFSQYGLMHCLLFMVLCFLNSFLFMAPCLHTCGSLISALLSFYLFFHLVIIEINLNFYEMTRVKENAL